MSALLLTMADVGDGTWAGLKGHTVMLMTWVLSYDQACVNVHTARQEVVLSNWLVGGRLRRGKMITSWSESKFNKVGRL